MKEEVSKTAKHTSSGEIRNWSILVVDRHFRQRTNLMAALLEEGFHVAEGVNAEEGIKRILERKPHVIIADPDDIFHMSGHEVTRHIPLIALSAKSDPEKEATALELGYFDVIHKPVNPVRLVTRVKRVLKIAYGADFPPQQTMMSKERVSQGKIDHGRQSFRVPAHACGFF